MKVEIIQVGRFPLKKKNNLEPWERLMFHNIRQSTHAPESTKIKKSKNNGVCLHCRTRKAHRRGLCPRCYSNVLIRERFPKHPRNGPHSARYKGGRYTDKLRRTWILSPNHPKADKRGYVQEKYLVNKKEESNDSTLLFY